MRRRFAAATLLTLLLVMLTGCFRAEGTLTVDETQRISGETVFGLDQRLVAYDDSGRVKKMLKHQDRDLLLAQAQAAPGVSYERFQDGDYVGIRTRYDQVTFDDFNQATGASDAVGQPRLEVSVNEAGQVVTEGRMDLTSFDPDLLTALGGSVEIDFEDPVMVFTMTMPGAVVDSTGVLVEGTQVTWRPVLGFNNTMRVIAEPTGGAAVAAAAQPPVEVRSTTYYTVRALLQSVVVLIVGGGLLALLRWMRSRPPRVPMFPSRADGGAGVLGPVASFVPKGPPVIPPPIAAYRDQQPVEEPARDVLDDEDSPFGNPQFEDVPAPAPDLDDAPFAPTNG